MSKHIVIVGAGALGSHLLLFLRNLEDSICMVDFDRVEARNLTAQFHTKMGAGRNKAQAIQQALVGLYGKRIDVVPHRLTDDNADVLLGDADLVVDCTDNIAAREVIQTFVRAHDIPCLHGALSADGGFGRVVWDAVFVPDAEGAPGAPTCEDARALPFYGMMGAFMAGAVRRFLDDGDQTSYQLVPAGIVRLS